MSELHIITNNHIRDLLWWYDLTAREQSEFDWIKDDEQDQYEFFRYKKDVYCLADFERINHHPNGHFDRWDGCHNDTFFSGILVKWPRDEWGHVEDGIIVGWYYC